MLLNEEDEKALDAFFEKALDLFAVDGERLFERVRRANPAEFLLLMGQAHPALLASALEERMGQDAERMKDEARKSYRGGEIANAVENGVVAWTTTKYRRRPH
jgi:hypothetical protein